MSGGRYLSTRHGLAYVAAWTIALIGVVALVPRRVVFPVEFVWGQPTRWTPPWEAFPALLGAATGALLAPRLASWERLGDARLRAAAALTALAALLLPALITWLAHFLLPADARWVDIMFNVSAIAAVSLLLVAAFGPLYGTLLAFASYAGLVLLQHAAPEVASYLPFSGGPDDFRPRVWETLALGTVAVTVWTRTLGRSRLAEALARNET